MLMKKEVIEDGVLIADLETRGNSGDFDVNIAKPSLTSWEMSRLSSEVEIFKSEIADKIKSDSVIAFLSEDELVPSNFSLALKDGYFGDLIRKDNTYYKTRSNIYKDTYALAKEALNKNHNTVLLTDFHFSDRRIEYIRKLSQEKLRIVSVVNPFNGLYSEIKVSPIIAQTIEEYVDFASKSNLKVDVQETDHSSIVYGGYTFKAIVAYKNIRYTFMFTEYNDEVVFERYYADVISENKNNTLKQRVSSYNPIEEKTEHYEVERNPVILKEPSAAMTPDGFTGLYLVNMLEHFFRHSETYHQKVTVEFRDLLNEDTLCYFEKRPNDWAISGREVLLGSDNSTVGFALSFLESDRIELYIFDRSSYQNLTDSYRFDRIYSPIGLEDTILRDYDIVETIEYIYAKVLLAPALENLKKGKGLLVENKKTKETKVLGGDYQKGHIYRSYESQWLLMKFLMEEHNKKDNNFDIFNLELIQRSPIRIIEVDGIYKMMVLSDLNNIGERG